MQLLVLQCFPKKFFDPENMKKMPTKVAHDLSSTVATQMALKQKSRTIKSPLIQDWIVRLDLKGGFSMQYSIYYEWFIHITLKRM